MFLDQQQQWTKKYIAHEARVNTLYYLYAKIDMQTYVNDRKKKTRNSTEDLNLCVVEKHIQLIWQISHIQ